MRPVELVINPPVDDGRHVVCSSRARSDDGYERNVAFWGASSARDALNPRGDAFVLAHLLRLMQEGRRLVVRGAPVTASLLDSLEEFQAAWILWKGLRHVDIEAEEARDSSILPRSAILTLSGGVDSAYSLFRHRVGAELPRPQPVTAALFVHGFDIALDNRSFPAASRRVGRLASGAGVQFFTLATDQRLPDEDWEAGHGLALAAAMTLLAGRFSVGLIAASDTYDEPVIPFGSNIVTDHLMGGGDFAIRTDGAHVGRFEKIRALCAWPEALASLRVCWQGTDASVNCGVCRKCVGVQLAFRALGVEAACFSRPADDPALVRAIELAPYSRFRLSFFEDILRCCRANERSGLWRSALEACVERYRLQRDSKPVVNR